MGGGQVGANWQSGWAVFGVQGDIAGMDVKGTALLVILLPVPATANGSLPCRVASVAVVLDRGLVYVKGGAAWMNSDHSVTDPGAALAAAVAPTTLTSVESTAWGWLLGFGTEWMITKNWTAFIEYNYIEFDKKNEAFASP